MTSYEPTIVKILAEAKRAGLKVTKAAARVNSSAAYHVEGHVGLFTKHGLTELLEAGR